MKVQYKGNFFQLPTTIFQHHLTGNAFMLYAYLISKPSTWVPKQKDIQKQLQLGKDAVSEAIRLLLHVGFLVQDGVRKDSFGKAVPKYRFVPAAEQNPDPKLPPFVTKSRKKKFTESGKTASTDSNNTGRKILLYNGGKSALNDCGKSAPINKEEEINISDNDMNIENGNLVQEQVQILIGHNNDDMLFADGSPIPTAPPEWMQREKDGTDFSKLESDHSDQIDPNEYFFIMRPDFMFKFLARILDRQLEELIDEVVYQRWYDWLSKKDPNAVLRMDTYIASYSKFYEKEWKRRNVEIESEKYQAKLKAKLVYEQNPYNDMRR